MELIDVLFIFVFILTALTLAQLVVIIRFLSSRDKRPSTKLADETLIQSQSVIHDAVKKADAIVSQAELTGIHLLSKNKLEGKELTDAYTQRLIEIEKALSGQLEKSATAANKTFEAFLKDAQATIAGQIKHNEDVLEEKTATMVSQTQQLIGDFTSQMQSKVKAQIETEWSTARVEVNEYKKLRMRIIDERITEIIEEVMRIALDKKFTMSDHSELMYKALDEAKRNTAFSSGQSTPVSQSQDEAKPTDAKPPEATK